MIFRAGDSGIQAIQTIQDTVAELKAGLRKPARIPAIPPPGFRITDMENINSMTCLPFA